MTAGAVLPARPGACAQPRGADGDGVVRVNDDVRVGVLEAAGFRPAGPRVRVEGRATVVTVPSAGGGAGWVAAGWRRGLPDWVGPVTYVGVTYMAAVRTVSVDAVSEEVVLDKTSAASAGRLDVAVQRALEARLEDWGVREFLAAVRGRGLSAPAVVEKAWTPFDVTTLEIASDHPLAGDREVEVIWLD